MRDINRIEPFLSELKELWKLQPDMRFGQLVLNLELELKDRNVMWNKEDDEWLELIRNKNNQIAHNEDK